jgi:hypothetical protein
VPVLLYLGDGNLVSSFVWIQIYTTFRNRLPFSYSGTRIERLFYDSIIYFLSLGTERENQKRILHEMDALPSHSNPCRYEKGRNVAARTGLRMRSLYFGILNSYHSVCTFHEGKQFIRVDSIVINISVTTLDNILLAGYRGYRILVVALVSRSLPSIVYMSTRLLSPAVENHSPHFSRRLQLRKAHIKFETNPSTSSRDESYDEKAKQKWYDYPICVFLRFEWKTHNKHISGQENILFNLMNINFTILFSCNMKTHVPHTEVSR